MANSLLPFYFIKGVFNAIKTNHVFCFLPLSHMSPLSPVPDFSDYTLHVFCVPQTKPQKNFHYHTLSPVVQIDANAHRITPSRSSYKTPSLLVLLEERSCSALMSDDRPSPLCYRSVCAHVSPLSLHAAVS